MRHRPSRAHRGWSLLDYVCAVTCWCVLSFTSDLLTVLPSHQCFPKCLTRLTRLLEVFKNMGIFCEMSLICHSNLTLYFCVVTNCKERHKLSWFSHSCLQKTLPKVILQGTVDGCCRRGRSSKSWRDNIKKWTSPSLSSLLRITDNRSRLVTIIPQVSVGVPQRRLGVTGVSDKE